MEEVIISLSDGADIEFQSMDIGVDEDETTIAFSIEGLIRDLDSETLGALAGKSIQPTEIRLAVTDEDTDDGEDDEEEEVEGDGSDEDGDDEDEDEDDVDGEDDDEADRNGENGNEGDDEDDENGESATDNDE